MSEITVRSFVPYQGDGVQTNFTFDFPYIYRDHVHVYIDDEQVGGWAWVGENAIDFYTAPANGATIIIRRETPKDQPLVTISNGVSLKAEDLNRQALQAMYVAQEAADDAELAVTGALIAPDSDAGRVDLQFPSIEERAGGILGFDEEGQFKALTEDDMPQGPRGDKGPTGDQGPVGPQGAEGPAGVQGPEGPRGPTGSQGLPGITGPQGPQGIAGPQGPEGPQGVIGPQGLQGPQGPQGPEGPIGKSFDPDASGMTADRDAYDGEPMNFSFLDTEAGIVYWKLSNDIGTWSDGVMFGRGPQGLQGPQGPQGIQGETGPQGDVGPKGEAGDQGIQGPQGVTGPEGPIGPQGIQGQQGPTGPTGPTGAQGPAGAAGADGATLHYVTAVPASSLGKVGDFAHRNNGNVYEKTGASTWTYRFSTKGPTGATGAKGAKGDTGPTGPAGPTTGNIGESINSGNGAFVTNGWTSSMTGTNIDHIWHDDSSNAWNFCSDTTYKGTANSRLNASSFYASGNEVWHAGNDGAGSGLNADLLDGKHASYFATASALGAINGWPGVYTGTDSLNTSFPVGTTVVINNWVQANKGSTIYLQSDGTYGKSNVGRGTLAGTWRSRNGRSDSTLTLMQRVA